MNLELIQALLTIAKICAAATSCEDCAFREYCGKIPTDW